MWFVQPFHPRKGLWLGILATRNADTWNESLTNPLVVSQAVPGQELSNHISQSILGITELQTDNNNIEEDLTHLTQPKEITARSGEEKKKSLSWKVRVITRKREGKARKKSHRKAT